jgi:hypothetical protein
MVKGEITLSPCYGDVDIPVEVLGKGPRPGTAWVRALNGLEPFAKTSHGGPYQDATSIVFIPHLRDVRIEKDPEENCEAELRQENGIAVQLLIPEQQNPGPASSARTGRWDGLLEGANTVSAQRPGGREA